MMEDNLPTYKELLHNRIIVSVYYCNHIVTGAMKLQDKIEIWQYITLKKGEIVN